MTQIVPSGYRGKAFSRFGGINRIGWFFGPVVGGYTAGNIGLDIPFYIISFVALFTTLIIFISTEPKIENKDNKSDLKPPSVPAMKKPSINGLQDRFWICFRKLFSVPG